MSNMSEDKLFKQVQNIYEQTRLVVSYNKPRIILGSVPDL